MPNTVREFRINDLIGVNGKNPLGRRLRMRKITLIGKTVRPRTLNNRCSQCLRNPDGVVRTAGVDDQNAVGTLLNAFDDFSEIRLRILGENNSRQVAGIHVQSFFRAALSAERTWSISGQP